MKRFWYFFLLMVLLAAGAIVFLARSNPEPEYEGRPITSWIGDLVSSDYEIHNKAATAVEAAGGEAVPYLVIALQRRETEIGRAHV